ncbi:MAG: hypothetical protein V1773_05930 [bacterium]
MKKDKNNLLTDKIYEKRLLQALNLYYSAWELKFASIKHFNPNLTDEEITKKVKEIFFYAVT